MKKTIYNTQSKDETLEKIETILKETTGPVAIMAGHFALVADSKKQALIPAIHQDIEDEKLAEHVKTHPYMGDFPTETWQAGVEVLNNLLKENRETKLSILANDWQWVPTVESGLENELRQKFFQEGQLTKSFNHSLTNKGLEAQKIMVPFKSNDGKKLINNYFFSENGLRQRYKNYFKGTCNLDGNKCAQEFVPFLSLLAKEGFGTVVSFVPRTCYGAIEEGSQSALEEVKLPLKLINIYTDGIYQKDFWENIDISFFR